MQKIQIILFKCQFDVAMVTCYCLYWRGKKNPLACLIVSCPSFLPPVGASPQTCRTRGRSSRTRGRARSQTLLSSRTFPARDSNRSVSAAVVTNENELNNAVVLTCAEAVWLLKKKNRKVRNQAGKFFFFLFFREHVHTETTVATLTSQSRQLKRRRSKPTDLFF